MRSARSIIEHVRDKGSLPVSYQKHRNSPLQRSIERLLRLGIVRAEGVWTGWSLEGSRIGLWYNAVLLPGKRFPAKRSGSPNWPDVDWAEDNRDIATRLGVKVETVRRKRQAEGKAKAGLIRKKRLTAGA